MLAIHPCNTVASTPRLEPMQPEKDALKRKMTRKFFDTYAHVGPFCHGVVTSTLPTSQVDHRTACGKRFRVREGCVPSKAFVYGCPFLPRQGAIRLFRNGRKKVCLGSLGSLASPEAGSQGSLASPTGSLASPEAGSLASPRRREENEGWQGAFRPFRNGRKRLCVGSLVSPIGSLASPKAGCLASPR